MAEATRREPLYITMHERDNVAIVANDGGLPAGAVFADGPDAGRASVPQGHKVALVDLAAGDAVLRYNVVIGRAARADSPRAAGSTSGCSRCRRRARSKGCRSPRRKRAAAASRSRATPSRATATPTARSARRNILAITTTVQCVAGVVDFAVAAHQARAAAEVPERRRRRRPRAHLRLRRRDRRAGRGRPDPHAAQHHAEPELRQRGDGREPRLREAAARAAAAARHASRSSTSATSPTSARPSEAQLDVVCLQDEAHVGFMSMIDSIMATAEEHLERLNARRRETVPASELVVGVQCGGSDAFSGVTANPAVGFCTDLLVRAGATVMFSEVTEVRDGIDQLTSRAATPEVADAMIREMAWYDAYLSKGQRRPQRQHDAGQQEGRPVEHRREGDGLDRQERQRADLRRAVAGREAARPRHREAAWSTPPRRRATSSAARCSWPPASTCTSSPPAAARPTAWPRCR